MTAPLVSVLLPVLNEARHIDDVLHRVRAQSVRELEIIVTDGGSTDETLRIVQRHAEADDRVRVVPNPRRLQSAGLNVALDSARAETIVRLDGHSFVEPDYVERCITLLGATDAGVVGGRMVPAPGSTTVSQGIAIAMTRWWGAGPAKFHVADAAGPAETVYLGAFPREVLRAVGGWAEDVGVNEDFELNYRIRRCGFAIYYDPALRVAYEPRTSFRALARQYFRYGRSKATVLRKHPRSLLARQAAPALLAPATLGTVPRTMLRWPLRGAVLAHAAGVLTLAARESDLTWRVRAATAASALVMHWCWSLGFLAGLIRPFATASSA